MSLSLHRRTPKQLEASQVFLKTIKCLLLNLQVLNSPQPLMVRLVSADIIVIYLRLKKANCKRK